VSAAPEPPADERAGYAPPPSSGAGSLAGPGTRGREPGPASKVDGRQVLAAAMTEAELERRVWHLIDGLSLMGYHTYCAKRSRRGFPDLTICGTRVMFRELKREKGRVTDDQRQWLHALSAAGADAGIWRPSCLLSGRVAKELTAISRLARAA